MTGLPIIEQLADAADDAARAGWLVACPLAVLHAYELPIRRELRLARFGAGIAYLDTVISALRAVRRRGGDMAVYDALRSADQALREDLRRSPGTSSGLTS